ncbi:MAG: class IV adenylate cyclase [Acidobacteria bacterium]|nr:class IV adenylate cyclase [Acidobacteriota bacterium]
MARNIEIKARIESVEAVLPLVEALADRGPVEIVQDDVFFACPNGRLKLRTLAPDRGELIFYRRADGPGPRESFYLVSPTGSPETLRAALSSAWGEAGRVQKRRLLFHAGRTRIHLDRVENLGDFLELEVALGEGESAEAGEEEARKLMHRLGIGPERLLAGAYVDWQT